MELLKTGAALGVHGAIVWMEWSTLRRLRRKQDLAKYYTYLSNLTAAIASALYIAAIILGFSVSPWLKGLRFTATYMLLIAMAVFTFVLLPGGKAGNTITDEDFIEIPPEKANLILHYLCPALSAVSFLLLERQPVLENSGWMLFAISPTIVYWTVYLILSAAKRWKDPYGFFEPSDQPKNLFTALTDILIFLLIPALSMGLNYLLWWINTLNF